MPTPSLHSGHVPESNRISRVKSVRLRLLTLALLPLVVLMPLLLLLGMSRWTADYDKILIANVQSDLRIAEQYLFRILARTGANVEGVADSAEFLGQLEHGRGQVDSYLMEKKKALELDFLYYLPVGETRALASRWPGIHGYSLDRNRYFLWRRPDGVVR